MATTQYEGVMSYVDKHGNVHEMYPEIKTDETLSKKGKAADAAAVGDKINRILTSPNIEVVSEITSERNPNAYYFQLL